MNTLHWFTTTSHFTLWFRHRHIMKIQTQFKPYGLDTQALNENTNTTQHGLDAQAPDENINSI